MNSLQSIIQRSVATLKEAVFPGICSQCGRLFPIRRESTAAADDAREVPSFKDLMGHYICIACADRYRPIQAPLCTHCGQPFISPHGPDHVCGPCLRHPFHFRSARAVGFYEGALRAAVHDLKYKARDSLAPPLGRLMWQALVQIWDPGDLDRVIPVPLHPRRMRQRGFNQAGLLVRQWPEYAAHAGLHKGSDWIDTRVLTRHRSTLPQTGLKKEQRATNLRNAFCVNTNQDIRNERILLVDDVMTTGTTADICAHSLLSAGAAEVRVLTLARAVL
jgi:ComF family protein